MNGNLLKASRELFLKFSSTGGFEEDIEMVTPDNSIIINFKGIHSKHNETYDSEGNKVNSVTAHIAAVRETLEELNYPYRNSKGKVDFNGHKVNVSDGFEIKNYVVTEFRPSDTFGVYILLLGDHKIN